jgi:hypothetical protein
MSRDLAGLADELVRNVGATMVAAMTGKGRTTPYRWAKGEVAPTAATETRLRLGCRVWWTLAQDQGPNVALAWLAGANPRLGEDTPVTAIREGRDREVIGAVQAFLADVAA